MSGCWPAGLVAEVEHRRVELDELEVRDLRTGAQRDRDPVAGRDAGVGGLLEDLPHAAGGQHDSPSRHRPDTTALPLAHDVQRHTADRAVGSGQQVEDEGVLDDLDPRVGSGRRHQGT